MEINEGNKLIMFFDGAEMTDIDILGEMVEAIKYKNKYYPKRSLPKFNEDWGLLMPIVEKIEKIYDEFHGYFGVYIYSNSCEIQGTKLNTTIENFHPAYMSDPNAIYHTKIESTWYNIIEFIKFYNTTLTPK